MLARCIEFNNSYVKTSWVLSLGPDYLGIHLLIWFAIKTGIKRNNNRCMMYNSIAVPIGLIVVNRRKQSTHWVMFAHCYILLSITYKPCFSDILICELSHDNQEIMNHWISCLTVHLLTRVRLIHHYLQKDLYIWLCWRYCITLD